MIFPDLLQNEVEYRRVRDFARSDLLPHATAWEQAEALPREVITAIAREGWLAAPLAAASGGRAAGSRFWGVINHQAGTVSGSLRSLLTVHTALVALTIQRWGDVSQRERWLPELAAGSVLAAFALSEPDSGSDAAAMVARYRRDGDSFRLDGTKTWVSLGLWADLFLVFATGCLGVGCFLVRRDLAGVTVEPSPAALGLRASGTATLALDDCCVSPADVVGRLGGGFLFVASSALHAGRYSVAWGAAGLARGCLDASIGHALSRSQFGVPIGNHQLVSGLLADMAARVHAAEALCDQAASSAADGGPSALLETNLAKFFASRTANDVARAAVQVHGATGVCVSGPVERHYRDAKLLELIEGTNEIQALMIAETLLQRF